VYKFAIIHEIIDRHSGEHHHNALTLKSFKKLKGGWERQDERTIVFDDQTHDEIGLLEKFISNFRNYIVQERKTYGVVESAELERYSILSHTEVANTISNILEDASNYKRIVEQGGLALVKDVVEWVFRQDNSEPIIEQLNSLDTDTLKELTTVAGISQINKVLEIWESNKANGNEGFWQETLTEYSWIISQIFAAPVLL
jgi:hypothetical protein